MQLLKDFQSAGYKFADFFDYEPDNCVLLRHDIDFSIDDAVEMAGIERQVGVNSTYFVLLTTSFYNSLSSSSRALIGKLHSLGSKIGLHFDPTAYDHVDTGFALEKETFEKVFELPLRIVSLHRPRDFLLENNRQLEGVRHTYEDEFFRSMSYISDSGGSFRFEEPLRSAAFEARKTIHLKSAPNLVDAHRQVPIRKASSLAERPH